MALAQIATLYADSDQARVMKAIAMQALRPDFSPPIQREILNPVP